MTAEDTVLCVCLKSASLTTLMYLHLIHINYSTKQPFHPQGDMSDRLCNTLVLQRWRGREGRRQKEAETCSCCSQLQSKAAGAVKVVRPPLLPFSVMRAEQQPWQQAEPPGHCKTAAPFSPRRKAQCLYHKRLTTCAFWLREQCWKKKRQSHRFFLTFF